MQVQESTLSATCQAGLCGIRPCRGQVVQLWATVECQHSCHELEPEPEPEEVAGDELAEALIDRWEVAC